MQPLAKVLVISLLLAVLAYAAWLAYPTVFPKITSPTAYQGYSEGEFVQASSPVGGRLDELAVKKGDWVKVGDFLFRLESEYEEAVLQAAEADRDAAEFQLADMHTGKRPAEVAAVEAQLAQAEAIERDAQIQYERDLELYQTGAVAKAQLDKSRADADAGRSKVQELEENIRVANLPGRDMQIAAQNAAFLAADAKVRQAEWNLRQKTVVATRAGRIYELVYRQGELVPAGRPVLRLLPPENLKVRFYVPERDLAKMHLGAAVNIHRDGAEAVPAHISYISPEAEYTPPVIYSNDSRYKLVFMIEAEPDATAAPSLNPGQPVYVEPR